MTTILGHEYGILTARASDGTLLASAMDGRDGWQVTAQVGKCQIFVDNEAEARRVLAVVASVLDGAS